MANNNNKKLTCDCCVLFVEPMRLTSTIIILYPIHQCVTTRVLLVLFLQLFQQSNIPPIGQWKIHRADFVPVSRR
jgi:hypothetical protein